MLVVDSKWSPRRIVVDHVGTLRDAQTGHVRKFDYVEFYGIPVLVGLGGWYFGARLQSVDPILAGTSIFTGLLFGVLVYVFQLRVRVKDSDRLSTNTRLVDLIDELEINVSYSILVGVVSTITFMLLSATKNKDEPLSPVGTAVIFVLTLHLLLSVLLVLKRTRAAYARVTE